MFNSDFFPTKPEAIELLTAGIQIEGKVFWEPEVGSGNIVDFLKDRNAKDVIGCENDPKLKIIAKSKCRLIAEDMLTVTSDQISHIDCIVMNPPFSKGAEHILHAYNIAPPGCIIRALWNANSLDNTYTNTRKELVSIIEKYGKSRKIGKVFSTAERQTDVEVALIEIQKPGDNYNAEFKGFFLEEDEEEIQENGIMSYNVVRDLVNRYVAAVKLYDEQLNTGIKMNALLNAFYGEQLTFSCTEKGAPKLRNEFKKDMQKAGWKFVFGKMNMAKYATRGLAEDINKFVEQQSEIPFTMKNIYHMIDIVIGTTHSRMDKALLEVFDKITEHHAENRHNIEGWKTNSHYLVGKKFILPNICWQDQRWYKGQSKMQMSHSNETVEDFIKALCYITGDCFDKFGSLYSWVGYRWKVVTEKEVFHFSNYDSPYNSVATKRKELYEKGIASEVIDCEPQYGDWFDWGYFRCKGFKKGSMHFEFKDEDLWGQFNQRIAKIKGYPLFEGKKQTKYQERQTGRATQEKQKPADAYKPAVLFEFDLKTA